MDRVSALTLGALLLAACGQPAEDAKPTAAIASDVAAPQAEPVAQAPAPDADAAEEAPVADEHPVAGPDPAQDESAEPAPPASGAIEKTDFATLIGDVSPASDARFAPVPQSLASKGGMYGRKEAIDALTKMAAAAKADGVRLTVVSAFRSFKDQKRIWEDKWDGRTLVEGGKLPQTVPDPEKRAIKILEFSSMPTTSRHHWGTDFDLNSLNNSYFASGEGKKIHDWLTAHAAEYGFCQPYSPKPSTRNAGYEEERWHWSYMPIAKPYLAQYPASVGYEHITGFKGAEAARGIDVIANYVGGINPACK